MLGHSEGGNLAVLYAATYPERVVALATTGIFAKRRWSPDYPWAETDEERDRYIEGLEENWGADGDIRRIAPSAVGDPAFTRRLATYFRQSASPGDAAALLRMNSEIDIRAVLPAITVPALIIHRTGDLDSKVEEGRWIASQIPGAKLVELPGDDHLPWVGDQDAVLNEVERFLTGRLTPAASNRLVTVSYLPPGASRWQHRTAKTASNGSYTTSWRVRNGTNRFVAQWSGDFRARATWQDTQVRSLSQAADALGKVATMLGVPPRALWSRIPGVEKADVDEWEALAAEGDAFAGLTDLLDRQASDL